MAQIFLAMYFTLAKTTKLRNDITIHSSNGRMNFCISLGNFLRIYSESDLIMTYYPFGYKFKLFYNGFSVTNCSMIDATVGGTHMSKTPEAAYELLKELEGSNYQWSTERVRLKPMVGLLELDQMSNLATQLATLNKKIHSMCVEIVQGNMVWLNAPWEKLQLLSN